MGLAEVYFRNEVTNIFDQKVGLGNLMDSISTCVIALDMEGTILVCNKAVEKTFQVEAKQFIGRPFRKFIQNINPNHPDPLKILLNHPEGTIRGDYPFLYEDRKMILHTEISLLKDREGKNIGIIALFADIARIRALEQEFENRIRQELAAVQALSQEQTSVIESSSDGILVLDSTGLVVRVNRGFRKIFKIPVIEPILGKMPEEVPGNREIHLADLYKRIIKSKAPTRLIHKTYGGKELMVVANPVTDELGQVVRVVVYIRDMTELNDLKQQLELSKNQSARFSLEIQELRDRNLELGDVVCKSHPMKQVLELASRVAKVDSTVLITGESGAGKEIIAKTIHKAGNRAEGPFIKINCAAIPENLLESELFGYAKGAFTGAKKEGKLGMLELANQGTLLLDEIGEMPLNLQAKLLRVLQEQVIYRIGGEKPVELDVRIIAATNKCLAQMVQDRTFREDLYYRLNVVPINVPPLRERREDILPLVLNFLSKFNQKYRLNKQIAPEVLGVLESFDWPGNVREVENAVERLVVMSDEQTILLRHLPEPLRSTKVTELQQGLPGARNLEEAKQALESKLIKRAVAEHQSIRQAAKALGISHTTLMRKLKEHKITPCLTPEKSLPEH